MPTKPESRGEEYVVSLREHLEEQIRCLKSSIAVEFEGRDKANLVAVTEMNRRLHDMNGLRDDLHRLEASLVTKEYYEARHQMLESKSESLQKEINDLREFRVEVKTKANVSQVYAGVIVSIFASLLVAWIMHVLWGK